MMEFVARQGLLKDTKLHVDDTGGTGRPVVLIHGWPLSAESWQEQVPALSSAGYRVISYDRRGFGRSDKTFSGYTYNNLTDDLAAVLDALDLQDVTLVGFSMGGGEVARYASRFALARLRSVVFAAAVPPYLEKTDDNPDGPLDAATAKGMEEGLKADPPSFYDQFMTQFFSAGGELKVTEDQRQEALALCAQADKRAALGCMNAFATTDFRQDLPLITLPTLVIHGDSDATVPFEGSGRRTHEAIPGSTLHVIEGGPHGINVSHAEEFNSVLLDFLTR